MISINREAIQENYTIIQELPSGFLGPTFIVKHKNSEEVYVCKICHKSFIGNSNRIESFRARINVLNDLNLSFVVPFTDITENENDFFIFRKYVEFVSLSEFITVSPGTTNNDIRHIFKILITNFIILHRNNIFPSNVKPSNIFIDSENTLLLTDLYELTSDISWSMQTPDPMQLAFLAPEFFDRSANPSSYSDVWSLGVILAYLRAKDLPWSTKNVCAMIKKITSVSYSLSCFLQESRELDCIITECLVHDVNARPSIDKLLNPKKMLKTMTRNGSVPLPNLHGSSSRQLIVRDNDNKSVFLRYGLMAMSDRKRKRQLSSGAISTSTCTIRCRFLRPDSDNAY